MFRVTIVFGLVAVAFLAFGLVALLDHRYRDALDTLPVAPLTGLVAVLAWRRRTRRRR